MRKWFYCLLVLVIAGLLAAAYYVTGVRAEEEFNHFLKSANSLPNLKVSAENYERGWLKSSVNMHVILKVPSQQYTQDGAAKTFPTQNVSFSFDMDIYHGPIIFGNGGVTFGLGAAEAKVPLPEQVLSQFDQVFKPNSVKPKFIISLLLRYAGKLEVDLNIPPFILVSNNNQAQLDWKGFHGNWDVSKKMTHIKGAIAFRGLTFQVGSSQGSMGSAHLKYSIENKGKGLLAGDAFFSADSLKLGTIGGGAPFIVDGFQVTSDSNIRTKDNTQLIDSSLKADVRKLAYRGIDYGPGVLDIDVSNLDAQAFEQIQEKLQSVSNQNLSDTQQQIFLITLLPEVAHLLGQGAELHVRQFQLSMPQGLILATAKVKLPAQKTNNLNLFQLIQQLRAYATAEVPVSWIMERLKEFLKLKIEQRQIIEKQMAANNSADLVADNASVKILSEKDIDSLAKQQAVEQLQTLVENGVLIQKENVYRIKLMFRAGTFYINGKPFNNKQLEGVNNDSEN